MKSLSVIAAVAADLLTKKELNIPVSVPTSKDQSANTWKLGNSSLSCGLKEIQGFSTGIGIDGSNDTEFEKRLALLTYWSANQSKFTGEKWGQVTCEGRTWGPIGVGRYLNQFLWPKQNYLHSSNEKWITRFEKFVKEHDLGTYLRTGSFPNPNWHKGDIECAVWVWNGKHPDMSKFFN
jgi:hypothetical protein